MIQRWGAQLIKKVFLRTLEMFTYVSNWHILNSLIAIHSKILPKSLWAKLFDSDLLFWNNDNDFP